MEKPSQTSPFKLWLKWIVGVLALGFVCVLLTRSLEFPTSHIPSQKTSHYHDTFASRTDDTVEQQALPQEDDRSEHQREQDWLFESEEAVRQKLKDGESAKFRNVFFHRGHHNVPMACGEVNSKNSYGAYGGYQRFVSAASLETTFLEEEAADFNTVWNGFCVN